MKECFKPIAVQDPKRDMPLFLLRCVVDLQLLTIYGFLRPRLAAWRGDILDIGAGASPWRCLMGRDVAYQGIDTVSASDFGMATNPDITYYSGESFPYPDASFDHALCTEVLEHVPDAITFLHEVARILRPGGTIVMTVPWSARVHHIPHDYARYSQFGLARLLNAAGFEAVSITPRGNDVAAIANKLLVTCARLLTPRKRRYALATLPCAIALTPLAAGFVIAAHASIALGLGSPDDPLGYGIEAVRKDSSSSDDPFLDPAKRADLGRTHRP